MCIRDRSRNVARVDANPRVFDLEMNRHAVRGFGPGMNAYRNAPDLRELDGVGHVVQQRLPQPGGVPHDPPMERRQLQN